MRRFVFLLTFTVLAFVGSSCTKSSADKKMGDTAQSQQISASVESTLSLQIDSTQYFFEGRIGSASQVNAELLLNSSEMLGSYRYYTGSRALSLKGSIQADNTIQLVERDDLGRGVWEKDTNETVTGRLIGKVQPEQGIITGTWTSKDGKKSLPFAFRAVASFKVLRSATTDVAVTYPVFAHPNFATLNDTLTQMANTDFKASCASVDTIRKEMIEELNEKERVGFISEHSYANVVYAAPNLVSVLWNLDSYGGGAHGNYGFNAITWKIENGKPQRVSLADIFAPDADFPSVLSKLVIANLKKQEASSVTDGSISSLVDDILKGNIPFTVHSSGLTFYFAPYYVASYAEGAFEVHIPWKQLASVLRKDGVARSFVL